MEGVSAQHQETWVPPQHLRVLTATGSDPQTLPVKTQKQKKGKQWIKSTRKSFYIASIFLFRLKRFLGF